MSASLTKIIEILSAKKNLKDKPEERSSSFQTPDEFKSFSENFDQNSYDTLNSYLENLESAAELSEQGIMELKKMGLILTTGTTALALSVLTMNPSPAVMLGALIAALNQCEPSSTLKKSNQIKSDSYFVKDDFSHKTPISSVNHLLKPTQETNFCEQLPTSIKTNRNFIDLIQEVKESLNDLALTEADRTVLKGVIKSYFFLLGASLSLATMNPSPAMIIPMVSATIDLVLDDIKTQTLSLSSNSGSLNMDSSSLESLNMEMMSYGFYY